MDTKDAQPPAGWYSRGYLPHFDGGEIAQFLTFRLADSLPARVLERWRQELAAEPAVVSEAVLRRRAEGYLDQGYGNCCLRIATIATMMQDALLFDDGKRYRLASWVVMPNHVHVLATPAAGVDLSVLMHSIKSYTAHEANKVLGRSGEFWQEESFDRFIRDGEHFTSVAAYIENNPVKARLCRSPGDWRFSSAGYAWKNGEGKPVVDSSKGIESQ